MTTPQQQDAIRRKLLNENPSINGVHFSKTGHPIPYETAGWGWGGTTRMERPIKPKWVPDANWNGRIGTGVSRRCPNTNRACQVFLNYQKFLQCYNKFEHLGDKGAKQKCDFFLNGVPTRVLQYYEEIRADGDWKGIQSNYKSITMESEDGDEDAGDGNQESAEAVLEEAEEIGGEISVQTQDFTQPVSDNEEAGHEHSGHDSSNHNAHK